MGALVLCLVLSAGAAVATYLLTGGKWSAWGMMVTLALIGVIVSLVTGGLLLALGAYPMLALIVSMLAAAGVAFMLRGRWVTSAYVEDPNRPRFDFRPRQ